MHQIAAYCALRGLQPARYIGPDGRAVLDKRDTGIRIQDRTVQIQPMHLSCIGHGFDWTLALAARTGHYKDLAWDEVSVVYLDRLGTALVDDLMRHNSERR